ncbi:hypothetical protein ACFO4L_01790 [Bacillus daqingensis]|uniref:Uncharacterized protein n=1 Tax=Bacillus daqingensis TaxID=872396 RepID=A0ABV9NS92_9BACI
MRKGNKLILGLVVSFALIFTAMPASAIELNQNQDEFSTMVQHPNF